jgi:hypothetical protein
MAERGHDAFDRFRAGIVSDQEEESSGGRIEEEEAGYSPTSYLLSPASYLLSPTSSLLSPVFTGR